MVGTSFIHLDISGAKYKEYVVSTWFWVSGHS